MLQINPLKKAERPFVDKPAERQEAEHWIQTFNDEGIAELGKRFNACNPNGEESGVVLNNCLCICQIPKLSALYTLIQKINTPSRQNQNLARV